MNKTKTIDNKEAVSASRSATCWADAPDDDAERYDADNDNDYFDRPLGYDDPNCCDECGGDLDVDEFCWDCQF